MSEWLRQDPSVLSKVQLYETEAEMEESIKEAYRHDWLAERLGLTQETGMFEVRFTRGRPMARPTEPGKPATDISQTGQSA